MDENKTGRKKSKPGRPRKYLAILESLNPYKLYSPAGIAHHARDTILKGDAATIKQAMLRIRITHGRMANLKHFPDEGDGLVTMKGQAPTPAWYGWRWQKAATPVGLEG